jgi:hypothetical protein
LAAFDAIKPDTEPDLEKWLELNREFTQKWPNITAEKNTPKDARAYWDETGKFDKYFSAKPGEATEQVYSGRSKHRIRFVRLVPQADPHSHPPPTLHEAGATNWTQPEHCCPSFGWS